uniref:Uncharacterized protein n=1 Tax=Glossina brevipalpis TaxID=37001 RepID=A0A1A9WDW1_9MUSC
MRGVTYLLLLSDDENEKNNNNNNNNNKNDNSSNEYTNDDYMKRMLPYRSTEYCTVNRSQASRQAI